MKTLCCKQSNEFTTNYITGINSEIENGWMIIEGNVQPVGL